MKGNGVYWVKSKNQKKTVLLFCLLVSGLLFSGLGHAAKIDKYYRMYQSYSCTVIEIKRKDIQLKWPLSTRNQQKEMRKQLKALRLLAKSCR